jgi:hypothetical protein
MLVLKRMKINGKLEKLQCTFPKLTETNQHYMLGLAEGLKRAQNGKVGEKDKKGKAGLEKTNRRIWSEK